MSEDTPPMTIEFNCQTFVVVDYWWEDKDFSFATKDGQQYCCKNMYPVSMKWEGLDCASSDNCQINLTTRYSTEQYKSNFSAS